VGAVSVLSLNARATKGVWHGLSLGNRESGTTVNEFRMAIFGRRSCDVGPCSHRIAAVGVLAAPASGPVGGVTASGQTEYRPGAATTRIDSRLRCLPNAGLIVDVSRISMCGATGEESIFFRRGPREM
jgi:hypothetical protein